MPNEIKDKFGASAAMAILLGGLASSTTGVGRQTTLVDNTVARYGRVIIYAKITLGTTPTGGRGVYFHILRKDNTPTPNAHIDDGAGTTDAGHTVLNATRVWTMIDKATPATGDILQDSFVIESPGDYWGLSVNHDTEVALNYLEENHYIRYEGLNPEIQ